TNITPLVTGRYRSAASPHVKRGALVFFFECKSKSELSQFLDVTLKSGSWIASVQRLDPTASDFKAEVKHTVPSKAGAKPNDKAKPKATKKYSTAAPSIALANQFGALSDANKDGWHTVTDRKRRTTAKTSATEPKPKPKPK